MTRTTLQVLSLAILSCVAGCAATTSTEEAGATASATTTGVRAGTFANAETGGTLTISEIGDGHATISVTHPDATETIEGLVAIDGSTALLDEGDCKLTLKQDAKTVKLTQEGRCSDYFGSSGAWDVSGTYAAEEEAAFEPTEAALGAYTSAPKEATLTLVQIDERLHFSFDTTKGQDNGTGRLFFPQIDAEDGIATPTPDGNWKWQSDAFAECHFTIKLSQDKVEIVQPKDAECFGKHGGNAGYDFSGVFTR